MMLTTFRDGLKSAATSSITTPVAPPASVDVSFGAIAPNGAAFIQNSDNDNAERLYTLKYYESGSTKFFYGIARYNAGEMKSRIFTVDAAQAPMKYQITDSVYSLDNASSISLSALPSTLVAGIDTSFNITFNVSYYDGAARANRGVSIYLPGGAGASVSGNTITVNISGVKTSETINGAVYCDGGMIPLNINVEQFITASLTKNASTGQLTAAVTSAGTSGYSGSKNVQVIIALYNGTQLKSVSVGTAQTVTLGGPGGALTPVSLSPAVMPSNGDKIKVFILDGTNMMRPYPNSGAVTTYGAVPE